MMLWMGQQENWGCWFIAENDLDMSETFWGKICGKICEIWQSMQRLHAAYMLHMPHICGIFFRIFPAYAT